MNRDYQDGKSDSAIVFLGTEVEKTPAFGMRTLFVVGCHEGEEIIKLAKWYNCEHIYFGANQSFKPTDEENFWQEWESMIKTCLNANFWCTLDFDVSLIEEVLECGFDEYNKYIPQISVKIPYLRQLNYNATIKLDDKDFNATNPGVWSILLVDLIKRKYYNSWDQYTNDEIIK